MGTIRLKCPWCGSLDMIRLDPEIVQCAECYHITDWYEAYKKGTKGEKNEEDAVPPRTS